ncbi:MAG: hypothetical protein D3910_05410 [Candidatus Electrothrix sp. ATG2]|nr:hypothetical protein [Candidatus Electrothrix sp. ATG2]
MRSAEKKFKPTSPVVSLRLLSRFIHPLFSFRKKNFSSVIQTVSYAAAGFFCFRLGVTVGLFYGSLSIKTVRS